MPARLPYPKVAPEGFAALSAVEHYLNTGTALTAVLLELVRLRCSLMNGCEYCVALHTHELRRHNEPDSRIAGVARWRGSNAFTAAEGAALRWAEAVTDIQTGHASDSEYAAVREHFGDRDLVDLTLAISSINAFNRLAISFRPEWHGDTPKPDASRESQQTGNAEANSAPSAEERPAAGDDGSKVSVDE